VIVQEIALKLTADARALTKGLQSALDAIDNFGNKFQRAANKVAAVGAAITAIGSKMISDAAKYDRGVKAHVDALGNAYDNLAVRIGTALIPALDAVTKFVTQLVRAWDSLSPSQRKTITDIAEMTAKVLVFVGAAGAIVGIVGDLAGLAAVLLPLLPVTLAIAAGLAGIALLLGAGYGLWQRYGKALEESIGGGIFETARGFAANYFTFMVDNIRSLANMWLGLAKGILSAQEAIHSATAGKLGIRNPLLEGARGTLEKASAAINAPLSKVSDSIGKALSGGADLVVDGIKDSFGNFLELTGIDGVIAKFGKMFDTSGNAFANKVAVATGIKNAMAGTTVPTVSLNPLDMARQLGGVVRADSTRIGSTSTATMGGLDKTRLLEGLSEDAQALGAKIGSAFSAAGRIVQGALLQAAPKFSAVVSGAMQGMQAGGPWGAIIGAVAALLSQGKGFAKLIEQVEEGVSFFVKMLNPLVKNMALMGALANALLTVLQPLNFVFGLLGRALFEVAKITAVTVKWLVDGVVGVYNWIVGKLNDFLAMIGLGRPIAQATIGNFDAALQAVIDMTYEQVDATTEEVAARYENTQAMYSATEALTNIPQGFKVAAARFAAMSAQGGGGTGGTGIVGTRAPNASVTVQVMGNVYGMDDLVTMIAAAQQRKRFQATGSILGSP